MIKLGVVFIVTAALLYTISIATEQIKRKLEVWITRTFMIALCCDFTGTTIMFLVATNKFSLATHSICGYAALSVMGLHLFFAKKAMNNRLRYERLFTRWSPVAWVVWMLAFTTGIPGVSAFFVKILEDVF